MLHIMHTLGNDKRNALQHNDTRRTEQALLTEVWPV
jgi:hypothetical protein